MHVYPTTVPEPPADRVVAAPPPDRVNECAIASVVLGALSIVCPVGLGFVALWVARRAQRQIGANGGRAEDRDLAAVGAGLAWAGICVTVIVAVLIAIVFVLSFLLPALLLVLL